MSRPRGDLLFHGVRESLRSEDADLQVGQALLLLGQDLHEADAVADDAGEDPGLQISGQADLPGGVSRTGGDHETALRPGRRDTCQSRR